MQAFRLARVALDAEAIRWKALAARTGVRITCAAIALLFLVGAMVFAHIAAWHWLREANQRSVYTTAAILGGFDGLVALVAGCFALRSSPSAAERDALAIRRQAVAGILQSLSVAQMAFLILRQFRAMMRRTKS